MIKLIPVFFSIFLFGFGGVFFTPKTFTGYFDTDPTTNIQNGTGNWDFSTNNFSYNTTNYTQTKFVSGSNVVFGKSGSLNPAGTVTVSGTQNIASLFFDTVPSGNYTITGGNLTCAYPSCTITNNVDSTIASTIIGNAGWTKTGVSILTLTGTNSYNGVTTVSAGALSLGNGAASGNIIPATNLITNNATLNYNTPSNITHSGVISGTGTFTKQGTGTLILNGSNSYTGNTTVSAGVLQLGDGIVTGNIIPASNLITDNAALVYDTPSTITHSGTISGTGSLRKEGDGTLTITDSNPYTGATTVNMGSLKLSMTNIDQNASSGYTISSGATLVLDPTTATNARIATSNPIITGAGTVQKISANSMIMANSAASKQTQFNMSAGGLVDVQGGLLTSISTLATNLADININTGTTVTINDAGTSNSIAYFNGLTGAGLIRTHGATAARTLSVGNNNATTSFSGVIGDGTAPGILAFTKAGTGTQTLTGVTTYTGNTTISGGTLLISGAGSLNSGSYAGAISNSGTFQYSSSANQILSGAITGTGALTKDTSSTSTLTLTGANTYSGGTTISNGNLTISTNSPNNSPNYSIASGATLEYAIATGGDHCDGTSTTYSGAGKLIKSGPGQIRFCGSSTFNLSAGSLIDIQGGTFDAGSGANDIWSANLSSFNIAAGATVAEMAYRPAQFDALTGGGTLSMDAGAGPGPHTVTIGANNHAAGDYNTADTATFSGVISGGGELIKTGTGTQILSGTNTHTGGTLISAGTLRLNNGTNSPTSDIGTGIVTIKSGATLICNGGDNCLGTVSAANIPQIDIDGGTFTASTSFAGGIWFEQINFLDGGTLNGTNGVNARPEFPSSINVTASENPAAISTKITNSSTTGSGLVLTVNNGLAVPDLLISGTIVGPGGILTKEGAGELILSGANNYSGTTSINAGLLGGSGNASSAATVGDSGTIFGGTGSGNAGTATFGSITFSSSTSAMNIYSDGPNLSKVISNGNCTMGGANFNLMQAISAGTFTVLQCANAPTGEFPSINTNSSGNIATLYQSGNNFLIGTSRGVLDIIGVAPSGAYSLRKIRNVYAGNAIRVRRSSDNTFQDIGFTANGDLDVSALTTFVGAGNNGFVHTWYDQSTHVRNATQATAANQPQIVSAGAIVTSSRTGIPSMSFSPNQWLDTGTSLQTMTNAGRDGSVIAVIKGGATSNAAFGAYGPGGVNRWSAHLMWTDSTIYMDLGDVATNRVSINAAGNVNNWRRYSFLRSGDTATLRWSGSQQAQKTTASAQCTATGNFLIGYASNPDGGLSSITGNISEFLIFSSGITDPDLTTLESSQASYWRVP